MKVIIITAALQKKVWSKLNLPFGMLMDIFMYLQDSALNVLISW